MLPFNLLLVEDNQQEIKTFHDTLERYCDEHPNRKINPTITSDVDQSLLALHNSFDGAIVDIKLSGDSDAGNTILESILNKFRIPVVAYTGNPENVSADLKHFKIYKRAEVGYDVPLDFLFDLYDTGLTKIFGGSGQIEKTMDKVFRDTVLPQLDEWRAHKTRGKETENALLRFIVSHIVELVDNDFEKYFPEEMYIAPPISTTLRTGSIIKRKDQDVYYVVLNPACDLAVRGSTFKTDRILVCLIESLSGILEKSVQNNVKLQVTDSDNEKSKQKKILERENSKLGYFNSTITQNKTPYYHYLPKTKIFSGGVINYRIIETFDVATFGDNFTPPLVQISSPFIKDIVARFSSYYARQGQPDLDPDSLTI